MRIQPLAFALIQMGLLLRPVAAQAEEAPRVVHVLVALCDNEHQGIVKVGKAIGNGQDPANNLYWGAKYGVKNHFKTSADWTLLQTEKNPREHVLERLVFRHASRNVRIVAEAYDGQFISDTVWDFLCASAGRLQADVSVKGPDGTVSIVHAGGASDLIVYIGHNGLMDFSFKEYPKQADDRQRNVIILACAARSYFDKPLHEAGAYPVVWTTNLMAPEAYTLRDALDGWVSGEENDRVRERAAAAYHQYQKCGLKAARRLLVTGFEE
ncbi:MAG: hypothetical protein AAB434_03415 [Planctomycetota bacterium]